MNNITLQNLFMLLDFKHSELENLGILTIALKSDPNNSSVMSFSWQTEIKQWITTWYLNERSKLYIYRNYIVESFVLGINSTGISLVVNVKEP